MNPSTRLSLALLSLAGGAAVAAAPAGLTVVTSGTEPALRHGHQTLARPFGAQLVDRLSIDGSYAAGRERLYLVRGSAGADCPSHYLIVATRAGTAPAVSAPFGTCGTGAAGQVYKGRLFVTIASPQPGTPAVRYLYEAGNVRKLDPDYAMADAPLLTCRAYRMLPAPANVETLLDRSLPQDLRRASYVRKSEIAPDELRDMVTDLACLATLPNGDKVVPRASSALFASKRYGKAAYAALDDVARTPASGPDLRAAVRAFSAHMHYYVGRRTVI